MWRNKVDAMVDKTKGLVEDCGNGGTETTEKQSAYKNSDEDSTKRLLILIGHTRS